MTALLSQYHIALSKTTLSPGPYTFVATDAAKVVGALAIEGNGVNLETGIIQPGQSAQLNVDLQPGTYDVFSPLPGFRTLGMDATITVGAGAAPSA